MGVPSFVPQRRFGFNARDFQFEANFKISDYRTLIVGVDNISDNEELFEAYRFDLESETGSLATNAQGTKNFDDAGIYVQYTDYFTDNLGLTLNMRYDDHNIYGDVTNYRSGLIYIVNETVSVKLLYGTSYKAPAAMQLFAQPLFSGEVNGNPDLIPETAETIELAMDWKLSQETNLSMTLFKTEVEDKVEIVGTQAFNAGLQSSEGLEVNFIWVNQHLSISANTSWQKTDAETQNFIGQVVEYPSALYPKLMSNIFVGYKLHNDISVHASYRYISERRASQTNILLNGTTPYQLDAYHLANVTLNYQLQENYKLFVKVENLLNQNYQHAGFNGIDIAGLPRTLFFGINFNYY